MSIVSRCPVVVNGWLIVDQSSPRYRMHHRGAANGYVTQPSGHSTSSSDRQFRRASITKMMWNGPRRALYLPSRFNPNKNVKMACIIILVGHLMHRMRFPARSEVTPGSGLKSTRAESLEDNHSLQQSPCRACRALYSVNAYLRPAE